MVGVYQARLGGGLDQYQNAATDERRASVAARWNGFSRRSRLSVKPLGRNESDLTCVAAGRGLVRRVHVCTPAYVLELRLGLNRRKRGGVTRVDAVLMTETTRAGTGAPGRVGS